MNTASNRGFTLIELLVVVAIIGILASIVLVSLGSARNKGSDAAIKGNLNGIRTQAELFAVDNGYKYSTDTTVLASAGCPTSGNTMFYNNTTIRAAIEAARSANGGLMTDVTRCAVGVNGATYAAAVKLKDGATPGWWCVDSDGTSKELGAATPGLSGGTVAAKCP